MTQIQCQWLVETRLRCPTPACWCKLQCCLACHSTTHRTQNSNISTDMSMHSPLQVTWWWWWRYHTIMMPCRNGIISSSRPLQSTTVSFINPCLAVLRPMLHGWTMDIQQNSSHYTQQKIHLTSRFLHPRTRLWDFLQHSSWMHSFSTLQPLMWNKTQSPHHHNITQ